MTQEEKQLLIKDLCARLPYGTKVSYNGKDEILSTLHIFDMTHIKEEYVNIKPYLRPLESMTEEEINEYYWLQQYAILNFLLLFIIPITLIFADLYRKVLLLQ